MMLAEEVAEKHYYVTSATFYLFCLAVMVALSIAELLNKTLMPHRRWYRIAAIIVIGHFIFLAVEAS